MSNSGMLRRAKVIEFTALAMIATISGCAAPEGSKPSGASGGSSGSSKGPPWTIQCLELPGPTRQRDIRSFAESLKSTPEIRAADVFVLDESDGYSRLYYGKYYRAKDNTRKNVFPPQLHVDLNMLRQLGGTAGEHYFVRALPVPMPQADSGDPAWNLANAKGVYSLQVAAFEPTDDFWEFKKAAAEYCEYLRKQGFEAYYYHTRASSMVTVGTFGNDAVIRGADQKPYYSEAVGRLQSNELLKYNVVNGGVHKVRDNQGNWVPVPSRLVGIPMRDGPDSVPPQRGVTPRSRER